MIEVVRDMNGGDLAASKGSRAAVQVFNAHVDAGGGRMFKSKFNSDGSMYQLDGGAVIMALLAHSTYLKELGVVDEG